MAVSADLGGGDVKNVTYWITFVKPDFVATLQGMRDETIDYPTDEGSLGALKLGQFFRDMGEGRIRWPAEWAQPPGSDYAQVGDFLTDIPDRDRRYVRFNIMVNWRQPRPDAARERDKVEVLREIRDAIDGPRT